MVHGITQEHEVFDLKKWSTKAACDYTLSKATRSHVRKVSSPYDLTFVELHRYRLFDENLFRSKIPTDVFVWGDGNPSKPYLTKIGGTPYRQKDRPWPKLDGRNATFVAQLCFTDSKDILPDTKLGGDVLSIFCSGDSIGFETQFVTEWNDIGIPNENLIKSSDCPVPIFEIPNLFGVIHRTFDFEIDLTDDLLETLIDEVYDPDSMFTIDGTKIGGRRPFGGDSDLEKGMRFIAALGAITPDLSTPFVNDRQIKIERDFFSIVDGGSLIVSCTDESAVRVEVDG